MTRWMIPCTAGLILYLSFPLVVHAGQPAEAPASESTQATIQNAKALVAEGDAEKAVYLLETALKRSPDHFDTEVALGMALLAQCDNAGLIRCREMIRRPYEIGKRLYKIAPERPEPYYLLGKSLYVNQRVRKGGKMAKAAIHYANGDHEHLAQYWLLVGDVYRVIDNYRKAKQSYETAKAEAVNRNQQRLAEEIDWRLEALELQRR